MGCTLYSGVVSDDRTVIYRLKETLRIGRARKGGQGGRVLKIGHVDQALQVGKELSDDRVDQALQMGKGM